MLTLPDLPYGYDALEPVLSADTLHAHHDKHHAAYVEKTNGLAKTAGLENMSLEELIGEARSRKDQALFNNAAQAWNHGFFWECMTPSFAAPDGALRTAIDQTFGGLEALKKTFVEAGVGHFGSGWVWLTAGERGLEVISTHDAANTFTMPSEVPLLACDLWEHAYYLDFKQDRPGFLGQWFDRLANWSFAERQFAAARNPDAGYHYPLAA